MTEQNLREFDKMTRARSSIRENERPMSPGVSSIKSSKYSETMFYIDKKNISIYEIFSFRSLRDLGIDNYPYPELPDDDVKLSRTQERQSLQNLNNRLAGYIDKVKSGTLGTLSSSLFLTLSISIYLNLSIS